MLSKVVSFVNNIGKLIPLFMIVLASSCSKKEYFEKGHQWEYQLSQTIYHISFIDYYDNYLKFYILIDDIKSEKKPLYFCENKNLDYIECEGTIYDKKSFDRYYGQIVHKNNEFFVKYYLTKKLNKSPFLNIEMDDPITTLIISQMDQIHCIYINFKPFSFF